MPIQKGPANLGAGSVDSTELSNTLDLSAKTVTYRTIVAGDIASNAITTAKVADTAITPAKMANSGYEFGMRNRLINGDMRIDQRNAGASVGATNGGYTLDRWGTNSYSSGGVTGKFTVQQNAGSVTPPAGFSSYLGVTSSAATSISANDIYTVYQWMEGNNIADLAWGTANAKTVTLSFWVRSSLTGTFGGAIQDSASSYCFPFTYTISSANTWEQKTVTVSGPTSGTFTTNNTASAAIRFGLGGGSSFSGTAGAWSVGSSYTVTGATSVVSTSGATWYITGIQLEKGSAATQFDYRPYATELQLCQRYFEKSLADGTAATATTNPAPTLVACCYSSTRARTQIFYKVPKRVSGTIYPIPSGTGGTGSQWAWYNGGWQGGATSVAQQNPNAFSVDVTVSGMTAFQSTIIDANWYVDSEL